MKRTIIDVGASHGSFAIWAASRPTDQGFPRVEVIAVEPIAEIASSIERRPNLSVIAKAVLSKDLIPFSGKAEFTITSNSELSTFLEINPKIDSHLWRHHLDGLVIDSKVQVECITLERIIQDFNLEKVDFLKIDTQGTDLSVLLSSGPEISKIMSCVLEFPYSKAASIYSQEKDISEGIEELRKLGFTPVRVVPNGAGECNAFFINLDYGLDDYFQLERELDFESAPTLKIKIKRSKIQSPQAKLNYWEKLKHLAKSRVLKLLR